MEETLKWSGLRDRHCEAETSLGKIWIRLGQDSLVSGIYTRFGKLEKWVPPPIQMGDSPWEQLTLEDGKVQAEFLLAAAKAAKVLSEK